MSGRQGSTTETAISLLCKGTSHWLIRGLDSDTVPKTTDIASSLVRDAIVDTINQLDFNREMVAKFLVDVAL